MFDCEPLTRQKMKTGDVTLSDHVRYNRQVDPELYTFLGAAVM